MHKRAKLHQAINTIVTTTVKRLAQCTMAANINVVDKDTISQHCLKEV